MLKNLVTLVTGAAQGVGKAALKEFSKQGAKAIVACDIKYDVLEDTCHEISKEFKDVKLLPLKIDVSKRSDIERMVEETIKNFKILDFAYNNAGVIPSYEQTTVFWKQSLETHERMINVNLLGIIYSMHAEIQQMLKQPKGNYSIVNTASIAGITGITTQSAYCGAKHGVLGVSKTVATELGDSGIRVNCVAPGAIATPMAGVMKPGDKMDPRLLGGVPMKRPAGPEEIAKAAVFLGSQEASYITGETLVVDGGWTSGRML
jgi:NAD(P)-dependent dehydrogenase (short-subunit alcohol dehydrogenase family)